MATLRTVTTEPSIVPGTITDLAFGVDVEEWAFLVVASVESGVEIALGHFGHVVFVQELALVAFLAQTTQPMLANHRFITANMAKWTLCT